MDDEAVDSEAGPSRPSANELRLGRRVLELEKERDELNTQIGVLRRFAASTTIPVSENLNPNHGPITIPNELIPTLSLLRSHINDLTRDNEALRYTFLGAPLARRHAQPQLGQPVPSSTIRSPGDGADVSMTPTPARANLPLADIPETGPSLRPEGVDLAEVTTRVKELILENEELGEMVLDAGRSVESEWQVLIDDAKRVIESLESDLEHHASVVEAQKAEIEKYKLELESPRSAPVAKPRHSGASSHSRDMHESTSSTSRSHRSQTADSRQSGRSRDDRRPSSRHGNEGRAESERQRDTDKDRQREKERDKDRRGSERDRDRRQSDSKGKERSMVLDESPRPAVIQDAVPAQPGPPPTLGLSIKGSHQRQSGDSANPQPPRTDVNGESRVDDRSWKRRK